ncbi:MAG: TetR/AcrR family transcriptional regulator [Thermotogota bacterium]
MAPKIKYQKKNILNSALKLLKQKGINALTARNIAQEMGCSTHPIYSEFHSLKELKRALYDYAYDYFIETITTENSPKSFLDVGVNYVKFSKKKKNVFSFIFMNKDFKMDLSNLENVDENMIKFIKEDEYVQEHAVKSYHLIFYNLWIFTHGLATLIWESGADFNEENIRKTLRRTGEIIIHGLAEKENQTI